MLSWKPLFVARNGFGTGFGRELDNALNEFMTPAQSPRLAAADVVETKDAVVVQLDLPGHDPSKVQVDIDKNVLTVRSERKPAARAEGDKVHRNELGYGMFTRSFTLPATVDGSRTEASYDAGVLTVTLPKREEVKPRTISVKVSQ